ncbi:MAG: hypothetical protein KJO38_07725 [Gammaproteobacteria bacterium]|nr:hypothetical protein [Gammaproteobacteria bacterium]
MANLEDMTLKALKISYLFLLSLVLASAGAAEPAPRLTDPVFTIEIAEPWNELDQVIVVNDSARFDEGALSVSNVVPAALRRSENPGG